MLYITTRNKTDSYTAYRALHEGYAPDGGQFLPIRLPCFDKTQIEALKDKSYCETVADILNIFFSSHLSGWDVEFAIGRRPIKLASVGRKITVAEIWHNTEKSYGICADRIYNLLCGYEFGTAKGSGWALIAIRIAVMFGIYGELLRMGVTSFDVAAAGRDFEAVIAAWYARKMGLPIGMIVCGCNENCGIWDLIHKGEINTGAALVHTDTPNMDCVLPVGLERLIFSTLGHDENVRYLDAVSKNGTYQVGGLDLPKLSGGMFSSVVGQSRVKDLINSVYSTNNYLIDPYTAISCGALQDYRAKFGESRMTLLITEESPAHYAKLISKITGLSEREITKN